MLFIKEKKQVRRLILNTTITDPRPAVGQPKAGHKSKNTKQRKAADLLILNEMIIQQLKRVYHNTKSKQHNTKSK